MMAVLTKEGSHTIVEVLDELRELGDIISGDLETLGGETLLNETTGEKIDVFAQDFHTDLARAKSLLWNRS